jgi:dihydrofolate reductase
LDRVYVDGGQIISAFLAEGLIDDFVLTTAPVLLGAGLPLFHPGGQAAGLLLDGVRTWPSGFVARTYRRA